MTKADRGAEGLPYRPCVGILLANPAGRVLVGRRRDNHREAWQMPQGGIDGAEEVGQAGLRELREETGITPDLVRIEAMMQRPATYDLPAELVPGFWGGRYRGQAITFVLMRFLGTDADIDIETADPEFSAWKWVDPRELLHGIVPFKRKAYALALAELGPRI